MLTSGKKQVTLIQRRDSVQENLLRFSSNTVCSGIEREKAEQNSSLTKTQRKANLTLDLSLTQPQIDLSRHSPEVRQKKLQQVKEEFLNSTPNTASMHTDTELTFPARNRLSQISVESESSCDIACSGWLFTIIEYRI